MTELYSLVKIGTGGQLVLGPFTKRATCLIVIRSILAETEFSKSANQDAFAKYSIK